MKCIVRIVLMLSLSALPCWSSIVIDASAVRDSTTASVQITTPSFSTTNSNELLLAFVATDAQTAPMAVVGVSGGGLTWELVARANTTKGTAEIWRAFAISPLTNVTVTANLAQNVVASIQVLSFAGVDSSGINGSGAIGATNVASGDGAPSASLVTTRANSLVLGVGNDFDRAVARTPGAGQIIVHQDLSPTNDTYWVQRQSNPTPASGTTVKINDTAPTGDHFNLAICEILAPSGADVPNITTLTPTSGIAGSSVTIAGTKFGASQGSGGVTFNGASATVSSWSATSITAVVPYGATAGKVVVTAGDGQSSNGVVFTASPDPNAIAIDASSSADLFAPATQITTPAFSTKVANELLLAFIATDSLAAGMKANSVTGAGLTWVLVKRTNTQSGDTEIWRAYAPSALSNVSVTAVLAQQVAASMQVLSFTGVDTTGTNGSGAIGATASGNANPGAPTASLTTTRANSWVLGVGNDFDNSIARRVGPGQTIIHQFFATVNDTYWMQRRNNTTPASGTIVTINDTFPVKDRYNLSIVEVLPGNGVANAPVITSLSPSSGPIGTSVTVAGSNFGGTQVSSTITFGGITATPTSWSNTSIVVPVPSGVALGAVPVVVTVTGAGASNSATFTVVAPLAISALASPAANANNWNNTSVTITYVCSGGAPPVQCPAPRTITTEGANQVIVATAIDANGAQASAAVTLNIDKTIPTITATVAPPPGPLTVVTAPATITFICTDSLSGVATCPGPISVTSAGANQSFTKTAVDRAGNTASATVTLNVQLAALAVTASSAPPANNAGWNNSNVTVSYNCTGGVPPVQCPASQLATAEGANQVLSATATDAAGQTASASVTLSIDKTPPVIAIASPADNSTVSSSTLQLSGSVTDALSGVASVSCNQIAAQFQGGAFTCSVTLTPGSNAITVSATDVAGNTTTQLRTVTFATPAIADFNPKSAPAGSLISLSGSNLTTGGTPQIILNQQGGGTIAAPITSASSTAISFVIPAGASTGAVTVASGQQSAVSSAILNVVASSGFTLAAAPPAASVLQGKTTAYAVTLNSSDGFAQLAALSVSGLPSGLTASFSPPQITVGQISILTITASATQPVGSTPLTISASAVVDGIANTQTASATISVQPITTTLFGRTLESDTIESPLGGIIITLLGMDDAAHPTGCTGRTVSDDAGNFSFTNLPAACLGRQLVAYNGDFASDGEKYASVNLAYTLIAGQATGPEQVHLPRIDNGETKMVRQNAPVDQVFSFSTMPGVTATVYAGTVFTLPDGTQPDPFPFTGVLVPFDRLPDTPIDGPGTLRAAIVAFQPADTTSNQPVSVTFPNSINTPPGVNMELDTLDPVVGELVKYGTGTVNGDGTAIVPDLDPAFPGHRYGITHFDWHGPMAPGPNGNNPSPDPNHPNGGDPVDAASGILTFTKADVVFGGTRGQVAIRRTYRTLSANPGPFGIGTSHDFSYQLNTFAFIEGQPFITLVMPDGNQFQFTQQPDGSYTNTTIPILSGAVLTGDFSGTFRLTWKNKTVFRFDASNLGPRTAFLSSITDANGNTTTLTRANESSPVQITKITDPAGNSVGLTYDNFDRVTSATDPVGRTVRYTYNNQGSLATVTDPTGGVTRYTYDAQNRLSQITDARGISFLKNTYDQNGKVIRQEDANGAVTKFEYTLLNPNLAVTTGAVGGSVGVLTIGAGGNVNTSPVILTVVTDPLGNKTTYHFNPQGFLIDTTDALGRKTVYELDPGTNQTLSITDPLNRVVSFVRDSSGNTTSSTQLAGTPDAVTTTYTYDPIFNNLTSVTNPLNQTTVMTYDAAGNLLTVRDPLGHTSTFTHDPHGEVLTSKDALGNQSLFAYGGGNMTTVTDPLGNTLHRSYDAAGRLVRNQAPLGQATSYARNEFNLPSQIINPLGGVTAYSYDANGNVTAITDALGHSTRYTYDPMDRVLTRTDPLSRQQSYQYDLNGNLIKFTDRRGKVITYKYDAVGRMVFTGFGDTGTGFESTISYEYDAGGRRTRIVDSIAGTITRKYDSFDRVIAETTPRGSVSYTYDTAGRRTSMTVAGQPAVNYTYDNANRLTRLTQGTQVVVLTYDDANRRTSVTLPNGVAMLHGYDKNSRLTSITYQRGATTLGDLTYQYDERGHRVHTGGSLARTNLPPDLNSATYDAANELTNWNGTPFIYDSNGNMLSDGTNSFSWNARGQLVSQNGATAQYDALGRRIKNMAGTSMLYDGPNVVQELSGATPIANRLTGGEADEFYSRSDASGTFFPLTDALGSTIAMSDAAGVSQTQYTYDPFGFTSFTGTDSNPYQYTGHENENGLYYYRARYYNPAIGRFISEDPTGFNGGTTDLYIYAQGSPLDFRDPSGKNPACLIGGLLASIAYNGYVIYQETAGRKADYYSGWTGAGRILMGNAMAFGAGCALFSFAGGLGEGLLGESELPETWQEAEQWLNDTYGGERGARIPVNDDLGARVIDNLTEDGIAQESKFGSQSLSTRLQEEIAKDVELRNTPGSGVTDVEWHFFENANGGGPSAPLLQALRDAGIKIIFH